MPARKSNTAKHSSRADDAMQEFSGWPEDLEHNVRGVVDGGFIELSVEGIVD